MKKLLFTTLSLFFLFSCSSNNSDDDTNKEITVFYYFRAGSVLDSENDEERTFEVEIDGEKFTGIAPSTIKKTKNTRLKKSHIKFKLNSNKQTNVVYGVRHIKTFYTDERHLAGGPFKTN